MKKVLLGSIFGAAAVGAVAAFTFGLNSGLNPGESVTPFHPTHVGGPLANTTNCFPCTFQNRPQVQVWVNGDDTKNVHAIAKTLNAAMGENKEFKALVVFVTDKAGAEKVATHLKEAAKMPEMDKIGIAYIDKSNEAISNYKINLDSQVKNTVFVYKNWKVEQKFVNLQGDEKGLKTLNGAIDSIVK